MQLTQQERWIAGFLVGALLLGAGIRLSRELLFPPKQLTSSQISDKSDSLYLEKVMKVDSLVRAGSYAHEEASPDLQDMLEARSTFRVNINTADQQTLEQLPRIGPALAKRIIAHRSQNGYFTSIQDLQEVRGIGPATITKLQPYIILEKATP